MTLNDLKTPHTCVVSRITAQGLLGQRLCDLGLYPGSPLLFVRRAPMNDPVHVQVGSYHVALRSNEAKHILIESAKPVEKR